ncbi:MAG: hypothetical protein GY774_03855 [Planctomycetes bacterium]|nr:hypothetical protein [Planctomycetota bacterium]
MSLLRSVIADARPRKSVGEFPVSPSSAIGWGIRELNRDTPKSEEQPANTPAQTNHLSRSLPNEKSASESMRNDAPGFIQLDNPIEQGIQGAVRNSEQVRPLSVPEEMRATNPDPEEKHPTIPGEESHLTIHTGKAPELDTYSDNNKIVAHQVSDSISFPENIEEMPGKNVIANNANIIHQGKESARLPEKHESQLSATEENTTAREELSGTIAVDENGYIERSIKSSVAVTADSVGRNESQQDLVDDARPNRVPPGVDTQSNIKLNLEDNRRLQKLDNAKVTVGNDQLVSHQPPKDLHTSSDKKLSPILQSVGKQESTQANSPASISSNPPGPVPSKPSNSIQQISRPLRSAANSEFLSSVLAKSARAELIAKNRASFHAGPLPRLPEKKHESPKVQIGQIDVIVAAAPQPVVKSATASSPIDLASRHYLRRL